jgi:hypothetical protein
MSNTSAKIIPLRSEKDLQRLQEQQAKQRFQQWHEELLSRAREGTLESPDPETLQYWACLAREDFVGAKAVIRKVREQFGLKAVEDLIHCRPFRLSEQSHD